MADSKEVYDQVDFQDDNYEEMDDHDDGDVEKQFEEGRDNDDAGGNGEQHEECQILYLMFLCLAEEDWNVFKVGCIWFTHKAARDWCVFFLLGSVGVSCKGSGCGGWCGAWVLGLIWSTPYFWVLEINSFGAEVTPEQVPPAQVLLWSQVYSTGPMFMGLKFLEWWTWCGLLLSRWICYKAADLGLVESFGSASGYGGADVGRLHSVSCRLGYCAGKGLFWVGYCWPPIAVAVWPIQRREGYFWGANLLARCGSPAAWCGSSAARVGPCVDGCGSWSGSSMACKGPYVAYNFPWLASSGSTVPGCGLCLAASLAAWLIICLWPGSLGLQPAVTN
ncbi:hypothetical protein R6Q57_006212 [Mikania cordata]